jgi:patatin-like phospholipase/acyl hydrolase
MVKELGIWIKKMAEDNMDVDNVVDIEKENDKSISTTSKSHHDLPWVEKYRPKNLDELIAHEEIISTLNKLIESNRITEEKASIALGQKYYNEFVKDTVGKLDNK